MNAYIFLSVAIVAEVIATTILKKTNGFTEPIASMIVIAAYGTSFYFLSLTLRSMSVGTAYAIWSGVGIVLISVLGWVALGQKLDTPAVIGIGLIVAGVLTIHLNSSSVAV